MANPALEVKGLDEFRRELRRVDKQFGKAFGKVHKQISERLAASARPRILALSSPGGTKAMSGVRGSAKQNAAVIRLMGSNPTVRANVFGMGVHWGGTPPKEYQGRGPWLPWVGTNWQPEDLHGLGPAITEVLDGYGLDQYMDAVLDALKPAFPD